MEPVTDEIICVHTTSTPQSLTPEEAARNFCECVQKHILAEALVKIREQEEVMQTIKTELDDLYLQENEKAKLVRAKVREVGAILRRVKMAFKGSEEDVEGAKGDGGREGTARQVGFGRE